MNMNNELELIKKIIDLPEDELYFHLGNTLISPQLEIRLWKKNEIKQLGYDWFEKNKESIYLNVRNNAERINEYLKKGRNKERILLIATVMDSISGYYSGIALATIAVLLVNEGIENILRND